jgi:anti-sigma factor RsiW
MTCREVTEFLMEYLSDTLPSAQRAVFDEHLRECPECVAYLESYKATLKLEKGAVSHPDEPVPNDLPEELVQIILKARRKKGMGA